MRRGEMDQQPLSPAQRARIHRLAAPRDHEPSEAGGELNIVPFLDIVMNILMFVLATLPAVFTATLAVEPPSPPTPGRPRANAPPPTLQLTRGLTVEGRGGALNWGEVKACARKIKAASPEFQQETQVTLMASNGVPYATVVQAMDAMREDDQGPLFPEVNFGVPR